ncbi:hypothetical protein F2P45_25765 [Massilia sp. CCM 8733]|uniref:Uncharacterized protein n=1 Tax=Massilia mucilaginosa TaxID=2609282 RepID=A0ABX0NZE7_9BURK|nr:hypothetical protein [Massilia mucilaginosa]NHZ92388.1 hypothetical protein [Massilia mucilaginosa]
MITIIICAVNGIKAHLQYATIACFHPHRPDIVRELAQEITALTIHKLVQSQTIRGQAVVLASPNTKR